MADNVVANAGSGGATFAADDIASVYYPRNKLIHGADGTNDGDVSTANPLPVRLYVGTTTTNLGGGVETGALRVTLASDSTGLVSIDDNSGSLTVDAPVGTPVFVRLSDGSSAIATLPVSIASVPSHAVTNAGTFAVQVDNTVTVASHAVTNAGTFAVQATLAAGASTIAKAEDAAHTSADVGVFCLAVRSDTAASTAGTDGDYSGLITDSTGRLHCNVSNTLTVASHAVTNAGTFAVQATCTNAGTFVVQVDGAALTALQLIDNTIFVDDAAFTPATSSVSAVGFLADETATDSVDEGDVGIARMTLDRKQHVAAELESNAIRSAGAACTPKFAVIDAATSGDNTLVAAVASKKLRVLSLFLVSAGTVNVRFESGASGTALTGQMNLVVNAGFCLPFNPLGWFETASNTLLNLELSGAISVDGCLTYAEVT